MAYKVCGSGVPCSSIHHSDGGEDAAPCRPNRHTSSNRPPVFTTKEQKVKRVIGHRFDNVYIRRKVWNIKGKVSSAYFKQRKLTEDMG